MNANLPVSNVLNYDIPSDPGDHVPMLCKACRENTDSAGAKLKSGRAMSCMLRNSAPTSKKRDPHPPVPLVVSDPSADEAWGSEGPEGGGAVSTRAKPSIVLQ